MHYLPWLEHVRKSVRKQQRSKTLLLLVICRLYIFVARLKEKLKGRKDLEYSTTLSKYKLRHLQTIGYPKNKIRYR